MSKIMHYLCLTLLLFSLIPASLQSQTAKPLWTTDLKTSVSWQKVTPLGQLIVSTPKGLTGINTQTGAELWTIASLKNSPENSYVPIDNSPFVSLSSAGGKDLNIIDPQEGKLLFSSTAAGLDEVSDQFFLYRNNKILVIGTSDGGKATEVVMADMNTGTKLWSKSGPYSFTTAAYDLGSNEVLITSAFFASKLNAETGAEIWKTPIDPRSAGFASLLGNLEGMAAAKTSKEEIMAQLIVPQSQPDMFIIAAQKKHESTKTDSKGNKSVSISYNAIYMAFNIADGKHKWPAVVEMKYPLGVSYAAKEGLIVSSSAGGNLNLLNYGDGTQLLGKKGGGISVKGPAVGFVPLSDGKLLIVSDNGGSSSLAALDPKAGALTFDKAAKIKGKVVSTEILQGGVLVGTDKEVNLLNLTSGEWHFADAIEGGAALTASNEQNVYIFNTKDGLLYKMDVKATSPSPVNSAALKFQGKESPTGIEITSKGVLLTSDQNLALIDNAGNIVFNKYFPAPGNSGFRKALLIANAVRAAYYTAAFATYSAAFGAASQSIQVKDASSKATKDVTAAISRGLGDAAVTGGKYTASYIKMVGERYKATTQARDYMLIMTAESKSDIRLVQVSKTDGSILNSIQIGKDKDPVYDVDLVDGKLYYMKGATQLECYKF